MFSASALNPTQQPLNRDMAQPYRPRSSMSWMPAGLRTGMPASMKAKSLW